MKIVVNDANILIDFCKLDLLAEYFHLAFDFRVVDVVWEELQQHQASLLPYVETGRLTIVQEAADLKEIFEIRHHGINSPFLIVPLCSTQNTRNQFCLPVIRI